ncbi:MAG: substrate-binding domain-containing protein, partial [Oscillospiraceae bacterium]
MKKLIALLLALVMVLALAACAAKTEPAKTETTDTKTEQTTTEETKTEDPAPAEETTGEKMYIPVMAKGFQHQFWQAVAKGSEDAANDLGVEIYFDGPASETEIDAQVNMVKTELAKNPKAMALAALSTDAVTEILEECAEKNIPVIGFDSGVPGDTTGAVKATACTNNENAAAIAADKFNENETVVEAMKNATSDNPVIIGCLSQDAVSASVTGRTTGFVNEMAKIAETYQPGKVSIEGHAKWEKKVDAPAIIIEVAISATTEATAVQTAANSLLGMNPVAIFCSNEGAVTGVLAAVSDGEDLAEGGKYAGLVVAGFDAGAAQKNAVRQGWFYGSVTQDPYQIGDQAVALAVAAANGEAVEDVDT